VLGVKKGKPEDEDENDDEDDLAAALPRWVHQCSSLVSFP
jgi:hypothetical protein